jgi:hypothetical protein
MVTRDHANGRTSRSTPRRPRRRSGLADSRRRASVTFARARQPCTTPRQGNSLAKAVVGAYVSFCRIRVVSQVIGPDSFAAKRSRSRAERRRTDARARRAPFPPPSLRFKRRAFAAEKRGPCEPLALCAAPLDWRRGRVRRVSGSRCQDRLHQFQPTLSRSRRRLAPCGAPSQANARARPPPRRHCRFS